MFAFKLISSFGSGFFFHVSTAHSRCFIWMLTKSNHLTETRYWRVTICICSVLTRGIRISFIYGSKINNINQIFDHKTMHEILVGVIHDHERDQAIWLTIVGLISNKQPTLIIQRKTSVWRKRIINEGLSFV